MKLFRRRENIRIYNERERRPLRVVGDAAISSARMADGRLVPLVIVDTSDRSDLDEFIRLHQYLSPGDVQSRWAEAHDSKGRIWLVLSFSNPVRITAILEFDIVRQGILVDQIVSTKLLYLQAGRPGDRFIANVDVPKIFIEVTAIGFREHWDKIFHAQLASDFKARGLRRKQAKEAARLAIREMREVGRFRMSN